MKEGYTSISCKRYHFTMYFRTSGNQSYWSYHLQLTGTRTLFDQAGSGGSQSWAEISSVTGQHRCLECCTRHVLPHELGVTRIHLSSNPSQITMMKMKSLSLLSSYELISARWSVRVNDNDTRGRVLVHGSCDALLLRCKDLGLRCNNLTLNTRVFLDESHQPFT